MPPNHIFFGLLFNREFIGYHPSFDQNNCTQVVKFEVDINHPKIISIIQ